MTEYTPHATDAERAGAWAIDALREGRYDLGEALARLAAQAARIAAQAIVASAPVPPVDGERHLQAVPNPTWQHAVDRFRANTPPNAQPVSATEAREYWPAEKNDPDQPMPSPIPPPTRKCVVQVTRDGVPDLCGLIAYWSIETSEWRHVHGDDAAGAGHKPMVREPQ